MQCKSGNLQTVEMWAAISVPEAALPTDNYFLFSCQDWQLPDRSTRTYLVSKIVDDPEKFRMQNYSWIFLIPLADSFYLRDIMYIIMTVGDNHSAKVLYSLLFRNQILILNSPPILRTPIQSHIKYLSRKLNKVPDIICINV